MKSTSFFEVEHCDRLSAARVGRLSTAHGTFETPCFLPIASHGDLRAVSFEQAAECGTMVIMANAWYMFNNTTIEALAETGGIHRHMGWPGTLFTDSGGYQVFSLKDSCQISDSGVSFGEGQALTPEYVVTMQKYLGSDIMLILDDCAEFPCDKERVREAVRRTTLWAKRSWAAHAGSPGVYGYDQHIYGIVQGGIYEDLRRQSCEEIAPIGFDGFGVGGLSIGMPTGAVRDMTRLTCDLLPFDKPRHLLGVGLPNQILDGICDGVDTFDCVLPIRKAQRGIAYTRFGALSYKKPQSQGRRDQPLDQECGCSTCEAWSREELFRLFKSNKAMAGTLASIHNLYFYHKFIADARAAIRGGNFNDFRAEFLYYWNE